MSTQTFDQRTTAAAGCDATSHAAMLDVTADVCPATWVKTTLALEALPAGELLRLRLSEGDALRNVPRIMKQEGHRVVGVLDNGDATFTLTLSKDGLS